MTKFKTDHERQELDRVVDFTQRKVMTYRKAAEYLKSMTGQSISHEGLRKIVKNRGSVDGGKEE